MGKKRILKRFFILLSAIGFFNGFMPLALNASPENTLVMAWNIDGISSFDPAQAMETVTSELLKNICSSLVDYDKLDPTKFSPSMAKSWDIYDNGKRIVFYLRDNLRFNDGRVATAQDLAWSMQRVVKLGMSYAQFFMDYGFTQDNIETNIQALDDKTLQLKFDKPYPDQLILALFGQSYISTILDRKTLEENSVNGDMGNKYLSTHSACVGPYKLVRWNAGQEVVLEAAKHYWGDAPKTDRIVVRHIAESGSQRLLLEKGDIDIARDLSSEDVLDIEKQGGAVKISRVLRPQSVYLSLNNRNMVFANDKVRSALRYLVDYEALGRTVLKGIAIPRASYMPIGVSGALDEKEGVPFKSDLKKAKELMREAGYSNGFKAKLLIDSVPYMQSVAQFLQENARQIGIDITIEKLAKVQLLSRVHNGDYDMAIMRWASTEPDGHPTSYRHIFNPDPTFTKKYNMNLAWRSGYYDETANKMVMDALFEKDQHKRIEKYRSLQRYVLKNGPMIYLFQTYYTIGLGPSIKKWVWNSFNIYYSDAEKYAQSVE
ncbi:ABC transporter substrate-binding protein [Bartonella sp. CB189]|uniref:ABC transporter substrate-binding protein n=1 Tax=Bartonella sp. CB189 TaxID=3112254 RepID=UPI002F96B355